MKHPRRVPRFILIIPILMQIHRTLFGFVLLVTKGEIGGGGGGQLRFTIERWRRMLKIAKRTIDSLVIWLNGASYLVPGYTRPVRVLEGGYFVPVNSLSNFVRFRSRKFARLFSSVRTIRVIPISYQYSRFRPSLWIFYYLNARKSCLTSKD